MVTVREEQSTFIGYELTPDITLASIRGDHQLVQFETQRQRIPTNTCGTEIVQLCQKTCNMSGTHS